jgi:hypothetical protein
MNRVPKILHQMAPRDRADWHPIWHRCQESWQRHFGTFEYQMWDQFRTEEFVRQEFPAHYPVYAACPLHIVKIDLVRYLILLRHGGIYADMDVFCYANFHEDLDREVHLVQTLNITNDETVQNCLMAGMSGHPFFQACFDEAVSRLQSVDRALLTKPDHGTPDLPMSNYYVRYIAGPILLSQVFASWPERSQIGLLPHSIYNPHHLTYRPGYRTKHMLTGRWGEIVLETLRKRKASMNPAMSDKEFEKRDYLEFRSVSADHFDFYRDYLA